MFANPGADQENAKGLSPAIKIELPKARPCIDCIDTTNAAICTVH